MRTNLLVSTETCDEHASPLLSLLLSFSLPQQDNFADSIRLISARRASSKVRFCSKRSGGERWSIDRTFSKLLSSHCKNMESCWVSWCEVSSSGLFSGDVSGVGWNWSDSTAENLLFLISKVSPRRKRNAWFSKYSS